MQKKIVFFLFIIIIGCKIKKEDKVIEKPIISINNCSDVDMKWWSWTYKSDLLKEIYSIKRTKNLKELLKNSNSVIRLDISSTKIKVLPKELFKFINLEQLNISGNNFEDLEQLMIDLSKFKKLKILVFNWAKLKQIPSNISLLSNLDGLSLVANNFTKLGEQIGELKNLKYLGLSNNKQLVLLPKSIQNLKCLQAIDLSGTSIKKISRELTLCSELKSITANGCKIEFIDENIDKLINLRHLNLAGNRIYNIPNSIGNCKVLSSLSLGSNEIEILSKEFSKLINLKSLSLDYNRFKEFPKEILTFNNALNIAIQNNSFNKIPIEIASLSKLTHLLVDHQIITDENIILIKNKNPNLRVIKQDSRKHVKGKKRK